VLVEAAARRLDQPAAALRTEGGAVIAPDGTRLPYTGLAVEAALIAPPSDLALKPQKEWRLLGRSMPRLDMVAKLTGRAEFGIDTRMEGMLHAAVRMNPGLGATMSGFDSDAALKMRGVVRVVDLGTGVAVVADNSWRAFRALDAIEVDWDAAPYPADTEAIFDEIAQAFEGGPNSTLRDDGDVGAALTGDGVIEAEYRLPYLAHATMEPMNALALFRGGTLTIRTGNQAPTVIRDAVAAETGVKPAFVSVETPFMGGGFGRRAETDAAVLAARLAMEVPGRPVNLTYSREEDMRHDFYRPGIIARMRGMPGDDGPVALSADIAGASVYRTQARRVAGFAPPGPDKILVEGAFDQPYGVANYRVRGFISDVAVPVGSWRSVGHSHNCFVTECFLDELAAARGLDPVEMRLRLMRGQSDRAERVLEAVAEMAGWGDATPAGKGRGVAFSWSFGSPTAQIVEIGESGAGIRIERVWCAQDVGLALDPRSIEAQIVSGIVYGLSAAMTGQITFEGGAVVEGNFDSYPVMRMDQMPQVKTRILETEGALGGVGEPGTPPAAPALANAIFDLTGKRIRSLPLRGAVRFA
ncbi:MAG: molybdopterin cofactor-binding domain-containing protein, partial [Paracoccaceae bacterium]